MAIQRYHKFYIRIYINGIHIKFRDYLNDSKSFDKAIRFKPFLRKKVKILVNKAFQELHPDYYQIYIYDELKVEESYHADCFKHF